MARTPLFPRSGDLSAWALNITQRIERDYAELKAENDSLSACITSELASLSLVVQTDIHSVSAVIKADISSVSAVITTAFNANDDSTSAVIKLDISSVSSVITTAYDAAIRSTSVVIKADLSSVSAVLESHINSVSATINTRLINRLPVAIVNFHSATTTLLPGAINKIHNIDTVSRSAVGAFRVHFTTPLDLTLGLSVFGYANATATGGGYMFFNEASFTTTSIKVFTYSIDAVTLADPVYASIIVHGKEP